MLCLRIQFNTVCIFVSKYMTGEFYNCHLHSQTDSKIWNLMYSCVLCCQDHSFCTSVSETTRNQDTIYIVKLLIQIFLCQFFGINPVKLYLGSAGNSAMFQCLYYTEICIMKLCIFSYNCDLYCFIRISQTFYHFLPVT